MSQCLRTENIIISCGTGGCCGSGAFPHWTGFITASCLSVNDDWSLETSGGMIGGHQLLTGAKAHLMKQKIVEFIRKQANALIIIEDSFRELSAFVVGGPCLRFQH